MTKELLTTHHKPVQRRTVIKGAAWSLPVIAAAAAAPLAAASTTCVQPDIQINWGLATYSGATSNTQSFTRTVTFTPTGGATPAQNAPLTATIQHSWHGQMRGATAFGQTGTVSSQNVGGIGQKGYVLDQQVGVTGQTVPTANDYQLITFTFSEPLTNLRFSVTDIDRIWATSGTRDFIDGVSLTSPSPFTFSAPAGSSVTGSGTAGSPWQNQNNVNYPEDGPGGQIDIVFPGPVTTFTLRYENLGRNASINAASNDQVVFITGMRTNRPSAC